MKRRTFLTGALASSAVVALAACGDDAPDTDSPATDSPEAGGETTEIVYWLWQDDATDPTWQNLADEFNASQTAVHVTMESIPLDQYQNQLTTAAVSGAGPDAARCKDWWLGQFAPEGATANLTPFLDGWAGRDDVVESLFETGRLPGSAEVYMLPHQYTTLYMYYRKDYFSEAGLDEPTTQEAFLSAMESFTGADGIYGMDVRGGGGGQDQWLAWMFAGGARLTDEGGAIVLNDPTGVEVNQRYLSIHADLGAAPPGSVTAAFADVKTNFASGLTASMIHHPGSLQEMVEIYGDDLGVIPIPGTGSGPNRTLGSMSGNIIMAQSDKQEAAWQWISWLSEEEPMLTMSTSPQGQLPVLTSVMDAPDFSEDTNLRVAVDAIPDALTWPALPGVAELAGREWNPTIQQAFQGELTSQEALDRMVDVLEQS